MARLQGMSQGRAAVDQRKAGQAAPATARAQGGERGGGGLLYCNVALLPLLHCLGRGPAPGRARRGIGRSS